MREDCDKSAMRKYMIFLPPPFLLGESCSHTV